LKGMGASQSKTNSSIVFIVVLIIYRIYIKILNEFEHKKMVRARLKMFRLLVTIIQVVGESL